MASNRDATPDRAEVSTPTPVGGSGTAFATSPAASAVSAVSATSAASAPPFIGKDDSGYSALAARVAANEAAVALLQTHVAQLAHAVKAALPSSALPNGSLSGIGGGRMFSPFDTATPTLSPTSASMGGRSPIGEGNEIAVLTQQIAALSTSVTQLQRLQTQNNAGGSGPQLGMVQTSGLPNGHSHHGDPRMFARMSMPPLESPIGGPLSPHGHLSPSRDFRGPRTPVNRSFGSSLLNDSIDNGMWGAPGGGKYGGGGGAGGGREWVPSPGGHMQNQREQGGSGMNNNSAAAPGAGIVVTKWEHLQLKSDLLRSISKYGIGPPNKIQARVLPFMLKGSDIIAQAPPTQERIISYVIPALQLCLTLAPMKGPFRGPSVIIITTTVDQATQCHKLVRNVGGPLGVRAALAAGAAGSSALPNEVANMQRDAIQILIGTPAKINEIMNVRSGLSGAECRLLILDEVDQLIARNLYENVLSVARLLPSPRRGGAGPLTPGGFSTTVGSPFDNGAHSPFNPQSKTPFPSAQPSRFGTPGPSGQVQSSSSPIDRQTCIFSNTIPTDVINFSNQLQVRDPVRVLVRREGSTNSQESVSSISPGLNVKHTYVYLTITGSARSEEQSADAGPGTIGSGRANAGGMSEEAARAKEYKLDTLVKMLNDYPLWQAIIHVGSYSMLEAVVYKLSGRQWETLYLSPDMPQGQKKTILQQWRMSIAGQGPRFLVCFDVNPKPPEIPWAPLVINFDLPRSVEGYALRAAAAVPPSSRQGQAPPVNGVIVSFVQAAGGDVEMLRSTECAYRFKSAEIPSVFHDLFQH
ncbi:hypothetical protein CspHIS471_0207380 [Cutaneotrichosporon sp. HIS471]|nr:hypothetical protein CspHIS471_0207380 [Cutaneotrichosporon sp. HIS471]